MLETVCSISRGLPGTISKIHGNIFYSQQQKLFYRWATLPQGTLLRNDDIMNITSTSLTIYDPRYLVIQMLYTHKNVQQQAIPVYLKHVDWQQFATLQSQKYAFHLEKTLDFVEKKADKLNQFIRQQVLQTIKVAQNNNNHKTLHHQTIQMLKFELPETLIQQLVRARYDGVINRKIQPIKQTRSQTQPTFNKPKSKPKYKNIHQPKSQTKLLFGAYK